MPAPSPRRAPDAAEPPTPPLTVFLHIPKTAGTSLVRTIRQGLAPGEFLDLYGVDRTTDVLIEQIGAMTPDQRARVRVAAGHQAWYGIHEMFGRPARYVTFLRSPVARVLSCYRMMRRDTSNRFNPVILRHCPGFGEYVSSRNHPLVANHMAVLLARRGAGPNHNADDCWRVNHAWMERADVNLANFWFVGFQESYDTDARTLCGLLGLEWSPHHERRAADEEPDDLEITPTDVAKCRELNWADAVLYELALIRRGLGQCVGQTR
ncbi:MAG: sulfotransferase family 2 domain-containing protein [Phycisphaeraceae bacterium]|nr:sulfotransferase family 2 domain-containing protein [Phycisphaeraceae bacterium]